MEAEKLGAITIPLARVPRGTEGQKEAYFKTIHDAYTEQYLEVLGVEPTEKHRRTVARYAPLEKCSIEAFWADDSAVAHSLRIVPPRGARKLAERKSRRGANTSEEGDNRGILRYMSVVPPDVQTATTQAHQAREVNGNQFEEGPAFEKDRADLLAEMTMTDSAATEVVDAELTEELERIRERIRDAEKESPRAAHSAMSWGEEGEQELAALKTKFILPFAAEKPNKSSGGKRLVPFQSPEIQENFEIHTPNEWASEAAEPVRMKLGQIMEEAAEYLNSRFPLELLTTRKDPWLFSAIRKQLVSPDAIRLIGLLSHLLYWTVFGHFHKPAKRLPELTRQSLVLTIQELWARLVEPARTKLGRRGELLSKDSPSGMCFVLPSYILALKCCIEKVFHTQYQCVFFDPDYGVKLQSQLVDQINVMLMNIFDPDCSYASFGALDSSFQAIRLWRKLFVVQMKMGMTPATRMLSREFRTTPAVLLLMNGDGGGPDNAKTRKLLQKSSSDTVLAAAAGIPQETLRHVPSSGGACSPPPAVRPHLDERRRAALYRTTCTRLASSGMEVLASASPKRRGRSSSLTQ